MVTMVPKLEKSSKEGIPGNSPETALLSHRTDHEYPHTPKKHISVTLSNTNPCFMSSFQDDKEGLISDVSYCDRRVYSLDIAFFNQDFSENTNICFDWDETETKPIRLSF